MSDIKAGDRVRYVNVKGAAPECVGWCGTVTAAGGGYIDVAFDNGEDWCFYAYNFERIEK